MNSTMQEIRMVPADEPKRSKARVATIDSAALIGAAKLVHIQHRGEVYSLRQTRLGKLILTK